MLSETQIKNYGDKLFTCMVNKTVMVPLTEFEPDITIEDAYHISRYVFDKRINELNEISIGKKIGVTSDVVQSMLGVYEPDFGFLSSAMQFSEGQVPIAHLIQPRAEAEIAFRLSQDLSGPNVTMQDVLAATESISACFEIVDSRIRDWDIKVQDTVADNASCGVFVIAETRVSPHSLDLAECEVEVTKNGQFLSAGKGSAVQGSPLQSVAWLANTFSKLGMSLKAGEVILSGSLVPLESIEPGDTMSMNIPGIGSLDIEFTN